MKAKSEYNKQYYQDNKELFREHYQNNKEKICEYKKLNKEKISEWRKLNAEAIKERQKQYNEENKEAIKKCKKQYRKENPDIFTMNRHRCEARKKHLPNTLTMEQWENAKEHFSNRCAYCGKIRKLQHEHFVPSSKGGGYTQNNILPTCKNCNASKKNKTFEEWYPKQICYSSKREQAIYQYLNMAASQQDKEKIKC